MDSRKCQTATVTPAEPGITFFIYQNNHPILAVTWTSKRMSLTVYCVIVWAAIIDLALASSD